MIDTSLGVTPQPGIPAAERTPATEFLGHWNFDSYLATADIWPTPDVGDDFRTEVVSHIPVVFVQGDWDTSTPVENLLDVAPYFPKGRLLIAEHGGHGVMEPIAEHLPDVLADAAGVSEDRQHGEPAGAGHAAGAEVHRAGFPAAGREARP